MHNWIKGIIQHHVCIKWGVGIVPSLWNDQDVDQPVSSLGGTPHLAPTDLDADYDMLDDEVADLVVDSQENLNTPVHASRSHSFSSYDSHDDINQEGLRVDDEDDEDYQLGPDPNTDSDPDGEEDAAWCASSIFDSASLAEIHACITNTTVPSWIE